MTQVEMLAALMADGWPRPAISRETGIAIFKLDRLAHYQDELTIRDANALQRLVDVGIRRSPPRRVRT